MSKEVIKKKYKNIIILIKAIKKFKLLNYLQLLKILKLLKNSLTSKMGVPQLV